MNDMIQILEDNWLLAIDPQNTGIKDSWFKEDPPADAKETTIPGIIQQDFPDYHGVAWYWTCFTANLGEEPGYRYVLSFGAVDYQTQIWLNGTPVGSHEGGESPFQLDVTDILSFHAVNSLVIRVLNPVEEPIDGFVLAQTPHKNKATTRVPGSMYNFGGIVYPVQLRKIPFIRIEDVFAKANPATGVITVNAVIQNSHQERCEGHIQASVLPQGDSIVITHTGQKAGFNPGENTVRFEFHLDQPHLWGTDHPYLYVVEVETEYSLSGRFYRDKHLVRCGFRDFRVKNGYFYLNGKRIFLRSTHTGNHYPVGWTVPHDWEYLRRDLYFAKACGFNTVRFITTPAYPEQLDFCDELGLLVIESSAASWCLEDSPQMQTRYENAMSDLVIRDRNHPSIIMWELLNETFDGPVFRCAHAYLPKLRKLDDSRLVLLGSGRWDCDPSIGSISNPESDVWEYVWGDEAPGKPVNKASSFPGLFGGYFDKAGDAHVYTITPQSAEADAFIRNLGKDTKPVYLSEYGIGSNPNVIQICKTFEQLGFDENLVDYALYRSMMERYLNDWGRWKMNAYAFPEDMFVGSDHLHARQRLKGFNLIRSNPKICGYNLTGMLDHAITGEGIWTFFREWKKDIVDALSDGWASLRWCIFISPMYGYAREPFRIEVVLANEDILHPADYPVSLAISGPEGIAWTKNTTIHLPATGDGGEPPLAVPVLDEEVVIDGETGVYELAVVMDRGGAPAGGRQIFRLFNRSDYRVVQNAVSTLGLDERILDWLVERGIETHPIDLDMKDSKEITLIGDACEELGNASAWEKLLGKVASGSVVMFFDPAVFKRGDEDLGWLPLEPKGRCYEFVDWLYHKECVSNRHPVFVDLGSPGVMDWDLYEGIIPHRMFDGQNAPDEVAAAAFATGYCIPGGYASGVLFGMYRHGKGAFCINTLHILENIGKNPAADKLLLNIVAYASSVVER